MNEQTLIPSKRVSSGLKYKVIGALILLISTGFVWMANEQIIASPLLRTMNFLWQLFICRCIFQFDLLK